MASVATEQKLSFWGFSFASDFQNVGPEVEANNHVIRFV
jgi:hypothetical protein